jgi:hypothetical protein
VAEVSSTREEAALIDWEGALARWGEREVLVERIRRFLADNQPQLAALATPMPPVAASRRTACVGLPPIWG